MPTKLKQMAAADEEIKWGANVPKEVPRDISTYVNNLGAEWRTASSSSSEKQQQEEEVLMMENVLDEISGCEAGLAVDKLCSVVMETLVSRLSAKLMVRFLTSLKLYFGCLCYDAFGSHVLESLWRRCAYLFEANMKQKEITNENDEECEKLEQLIAELCEQLDQVQEWWPLIYDARGTHVARAICSILAGRIPETRSRSTTARNHQQNNNDNSSESIRIHESRVLGAALVRIINVLVEAKPEDLLDAVKNTYSGPFIQNILRFYSPKKPAWSSLVYKILAIPNDDDDNAVVHENSGGGPFQDLARDPSGSRFLDVVLTHCRKSVLEKLLLSHFKGNWVHLANHRIANFVVQKCLLALRTSEQVRDAATELGEECGEIYKKGHVGVLWRLAEAAKLRGDVEVQKSVTSFIINGIHNGKQSTGDSDAYTSSRALGFAELLLWGKHGFSSAPISAPTSSDDDQTAAAAPSAAVSHGRFAKVHVSISIPGAQTLKELLLFSTEANRAVMESVASLDQNALVALAKDPVGGKFVLEIILDNKDENCTWVKKRIGMRLKGSYATLAMDKFGHHVIRKLFENGVGSGIQLAIAEELVKVERALSGSAFGSYLVQELSLEQFKKHPNDWKAGNERRSMKRKKLEGWLEKDFGTSKQLHTAVVGAAAGAESSTAKSLHSTSSSEAPSKKKAKSSR